MDISSLTNLISSFRNETQEESISPEVLGALLQRIADVIATTAQQSDVASLAAWRTALQNLGSMLNGISIGSDDRNSVFLSITKSDLKTNKSQVLTNSVSIRQATTERAGVMRAQQVTDLNKCKTDISAVSKDITSLQISLSDLEKSITSVQLSITSLRCGTSTMDIDIKQLQTDISSLKSAIRTLQNNINTFASMRQTTSVHIEAIIKDNKIYIQGAYQLVKSGLIPVIFRYTTRTSRRWTDKENPELPREYLPKRRGWNRFFDSKKIIINSDDTVSFRMEKLQPNETKHQYMQTPEALFSKVKVMELPDGKINKIRIPYGQKLFDILYKYHSFKFAVGFYKETDFSWAFRFSDLRTNLAVFKVIACARRTDEQNYEVSYNFSKF